VPVNTLEIFLQENFMFQPNNGHNSEANTQKHGGVDAPEGSQTEQHEAFLQYVTISMT
jgi:hypothetical protein